MVMARPCHTRQLTPRQGHLRQWLALTMVGLAVGLGTLRLLTFPSWLPVPAVVSRDSLAAFPQVMLWAWERPESLEFIDPNGVGVAFLARTLYLSGPEVIVRPRLQPLRVPQETKLMAVVRIEADRRRPPDLSVSQRELATAAIADVSGLRGVRALQVDFDAAVSQRTFYHDMLHHLRQQLPDSVPLSMTALASWCLYDDWLTGLPVDEVVPMVFRMGADQHRVRRHLAHGDFRPAYCRQSLGIATDEPLPTLQARRRLYLFHPHVWQAEAMTHILEEVGHGP
jgi:Protein of unknown function (DUF3142)